MCHWALSNYRWKYLKVCLIARRSNFFSARTQTHVRLSHTYRRITIHLVEHLSQNSTIQTTISKVTFNRVSLEAFEKQQRGFKPNPRKNGMKWKSVWYRHISFSVHNALGINRQLIVKKLIKVEKKPWQRLSGIKTPSLTTSPQKSHKKSPTTPASVVVLRCTTQFYHPTWPPQNQGICFENGN